MGRVGGRSSLVGAPFDLEGSPVKLIVRLLAGAPIVVAVIAAVLALREHDVGDGPVVTGAPQPGSHELAFVANGVAGTITVYDLTSDVVVGTIGIVPDGRKVGLFRAPLQSLFGQPRAERNGFNFAQDTDVSPDGRVLYVSRGNLGDVAAFDLASGHLLWRRAVGVGRSDHMTLSADGRYLFVSVLAKSLVKRIDTHTARTDGEFASGSFPHDNHLSADGRRLFNASLGDMRLPEAQRGRAGTGGVPPYVVTVADPVTMRVITRLPFPRGIRPFELSRDETRLYAQLSNTHDVVAYDMARRAIVDTLHLPVAPGVTVADWDFDAPHHGLALTRDGKTLCLAGRASDYAAIVATDPLTLLATVPVGDAPSWAVIDRADRRCLVANTRADTVSIVSLPQRRLIGGFPTGRGPKHITLAEVPVAIVAAIHARSTTRRRLHAIIALRSPCVHSIERRDEHLPGKPRQ